MGITLRGTELRVGKDGRGGHVPYLVVFFSREKSGQEMMGVWKLSEDGWAEFQFYTPARREEMLDPGAPRWGVNYDYWKVNPEESKILRAAANKALAERLGTVNVTLQGRRKKVLFDEQTNKVLILSDGGEGGNPIRNCFPGGIIPREAFFN